MHCRVHENELRSQEAAQKDWHQREERDQVLDRMTLQTTSDRRARDATKGASLSTVGRLTLNAELLDLPSVIAGKLPGPLASRYSLNFNP